MRIDWIKRILVVGAGTTGHSIAMVFAQSGLETDLVDAKEDVLEKALKLIQSNLKTLREAELIPYTSSQRIVRQRR